MTREEFKETYYEKTGEWLSDEQLDNYIESIDYDQSFSDNQHTTKQNERIHESDSQVEDEYDLFDDNLADEFNNIFSTIANKIKLSLTKRNNSENLESELEEFIFYGELFLAKSLLYFILKKGVKKGYKFIKF
ncbi:hypothetical protein [Clostridium sp.]|uniref:hypothetical protein n=1 Tax=Clostridium sp. TaxID=1506 RepID=UPI00284D748D|nr:hypothetical protein [Clostridium sp.]MDR3595058.1 hypothetical protein [Clostridium sp.]